MGGITDFVKAFGGDNIAALAGAGLNFYNASQGLDWKKKMDKENLRKNNILFEQEQEDRKAREDGLKAFQDV